MAGELFIAPWPVRNRERFYRLPPEAKPQLTGREFHDVRKIISQQVSYYDTLRSLDPENKEALLISRFLAAINGLAVPLLVVNFVVAIQKQLAAFLDINRSNRFASDEIVCRRAWR